MRIMSAIFTKQLNDVFKNPTVTITFILFPIMAFAMANFMGGDILAEGGSPFIIISSIATMAAAAMPLTAMASYISEDIETKSLRFLIMAGVKPMQYLFGIGLFTLFLSVIAMAAFPIIGELPGQDLGLFALAAILGLLTSLTFGAVLGIISKNVQQGMTLASIAMLVFSFTPMFATFNPGIMKFTQFLFGQQIDNIFRYIALGGGEEAAESFYEVFGINFSSTNSILIICANFAVFAILFFIVYRKRGMTKD